MSANKVKKVRTQLAISQRELAERAGTSQQQIQRIEAGKITTSLTLAKSICAALGKPLDIVFPAAAQALKDLRNEVKQTRYLTDEALSRVASSGIEADDKRWMLKVLLKGHQESLLFHISASEKRRLYSHVQHEKDGPLVQFIVFDTEHDRISLNLSEVSFCQFLYEMPNARMEYAAPEGTNPKHNVLITLAGGGPTVGLDVAEDVADAADDPEDDGIGQLDHILYMMELDVDASDRYLIVDCDGEGAFIRAGSVALFRVALWTLGEAKDADELDA